MSDFYLSREVEDCRRQNHRFVIAGSDKSPLKRNLICETCTNVNPGKTVYVAYGYEVGSFGLWRSRKRESEQDESRTDG